MKEISVVVLTKNSERTLRDCLKSISWAKEIIIVDDYSTDKTLKIAKRFKTRIFKRRLNGDFSSQRNFGLSKAKFDWVMFLDSDEQITSFKIPEGFNGFAVKRTDIWLHYPISCGENSIGLLRLARKGTGKWKRKVHEYWDVKGNMGVLDATIFHHPHPSVSEFLKEINTYSSIHAMENKREKKEPSIFKVVFYPLGKFINSFVLKSGFRDETHGFVIAILMSFHSFLSWSQLWLISKRKY